MDGLSGSASAGAASAGGFFCAVEAKAGSIRSRQVNVLRRLNSGLLRPRLRPLRLALHRAPAHIHRGTCGSSGPIIISLKDVVHGKSVTQIPVATWMSATKSGPLYINVHKSNMVFNTILACGAIAAPQTVF